MTNYEKVAQICSLIQTSDFIFLFVRRIFLRLVPCVQLAEHKKGACQDSLTVLRSQRHYFSWREKILVKTRQLSRDYSATFSPGGKSSWSRLPSCTAITVPLFAWREKRNMRVKTRQLYRDHSAIVSPGVRKESSPAITAPQFLLAGEKKDGRSRLASCLAITAPLFRLAEEKKDVWSRLASCPRSQRHNFAWREKGVVKTI